MKRHSIDVFSLISGLLVIGTAIVLLTPEADVTAFASYAPLAIIGVGIALLFAASPRSDSSPLAESAHKPAETAGSHGAEPGHTLRDPYDDGLSDDGEDGYTGDEYADDPNGRTNDTDEFTGDPGATQPLPRQSD